MITSILTSVKKYLNIAESDTSFDEDVTMHINSAFANLNSLGIGPADGFEISDKDTEWSAYLGTDKNLNSVKSYVYLNVRKAFDPPATSFHLAALDQQIEQYAFRLNVERESKLFGRIDLFVSLVIHAGQPVTQRARVIDGKNIWSDLSLFEAKMLVADGLTVDSKVLSDLSQYLSTAFDGNDITVTFSMTGQQTMNLTSGMYQIILSDIGDVDAQLIPVLDGVFQVVQTPFSVRGS